MRDFRRGEDGASSVEYGLIVFAIAGLIVLILFAFGGVTDEMFTDSCEEIRTGVAGSGMSPPTCS